MEWQKIILGCFKIKNGKIIRRKYDKHVFCNVCTVFLNVLLTIINIYFKIYILLYKKLPKIILGCPTMGIAKYNKEIS